MLCVPVFIYFIVLTEQMGTRDTVLPYNDVYTFKICKQRSELYGGLINLLLKEYFWALLPLTKVTSLRIIEINLEIEF